MNTYHYYLKDHLGNVRGVLRRTGATTGTVEQQSDYYPFGLQKVVASGGINRYLYNGKELQGELGYYDYGARQYDPLIGRWNVVDPVAEGYKIVSPYAYVGNDPVLFLDPNGMYKVSSDGTITIDKSHEIAALFNYLSARGNASAAEIANYIMFGDNGFSWELEEVVVSDLSSYGGGGSWVGVAQSRVSDAVGLMGNINLIRTAHFGFENTKYALGVGGGLYGGFRTAVAPGNQWLGQNGRYYNTSWGGNQYTGSRSAALRAASIYKWAARSAGFASVLIGGVETYRGYQIDGGQFGYNAQSAAAQTIGGIGGGIGGAALGAKVGAGFGALFWGVGAVPGAIVGGFIGGYLGGELGSGAGQGSVNLYHKR